MHNDGIVRYFSHEIKRKRKLKKNVLQRNRVNYEKC